MGRLLGPIVTDSYPRAAIGSIVTDSLWLQVYTVVGGNRLTASTAFPALSLLNTLREPLQQLPEVLMALLVEGRVSLDRMNACKSTGAIIVFVCL